MSLAIATVVSKRRRLALPLALGAIVLSACVVLGVMKLNNSAGQSSVEGMASRLYTVLPMNLDVIVVKDGELQAVDNIELISKVEGRATITDIVKEGASVKAGDVLVQLDSSTIRQSIEDESLGEQKDSAALTNAREILEIQKSNNNAELEGAEVGLQLAEIDLRKYSEGTFPQDQATARTKLDMAKIDLQNKLDDLNQTKALFARGFVTAAEVKKSELAVTQARNALSEAETALMVLTDYTYQSEMATRQNALAQAKNKLERVKRQNESMINQKNADVDAAETALQTRKRKLAKLKEQLAECTITAPADGLVVYMNNRYEQTVIQQGTQVSERQVILRLPDTRSMKAIVRLNEGQVTRVRPGQRAKIAFKGIQGLEVTGLVEKVSVVADSGNRWMNPDSREYPTELKLDTTPEGVKPGMGVVAEIMSEQREGVLAVKVASLYTVNRQSYVFVMKGEKIQPRAVTLGASNTTHVEVMSGLESGERVLELQANEGKILLEQSGIKPATQPAQGEGAPAAPIPTESPPSAVQSPNPAANTSGAPRERRGGGGPRGQ
ncbi:MAG TPA: HlyD family efflux transporter periplasmic adaptor subunit [Tepidisphaeraceae bacterium]|nr:HlyD family efflux transporter periplasmic adaptor subunit [Tepidisphaeraceae bacterium]